MGPRYAQLPATFPFSRPEFPTQNPCQLGNSYNLSLSACRKACSFYMCGHCPLFSLLHGAGKEMGFAWSWGPAWSLRPLETCYPKGDEAFPWASSSQGSSQPLSKPSPVFGVYKWARLSSTEP
jgi:hypothetical protein